MVAVKLWPYAIVALALIVALFVTFDFRRSHPGRESARVSSAIDWQRMAAPGPLSAAHAFLEHDCTACHTPIEGVEASNCIVCHANVESLLQRQPTAFHANVGRCADCHVEHQGASRRPTNMQHSALTRIGLRLLANAGERNRALSDATELRAKLLYWIREQEKGEPGSMAAASITPEESVLRCEACHANEDRHSSLFGRDCAQCHGTDTWMIVGFRHPSPRSMQCAQCHQAPPSHYMEHFRMVSMRVARQSRAEVNQCYLCHQSTAWTDIRGVGHYKHH